MLGSSRFAAEMHLEIGPLLAAAVADAEARGLPVSVVGWGKRARGLFVFDEEWRPAAVRRAACT